MATFSIYRDLDLNGILDDYDPLLDSETQLVNLPVGDTLTYSGTFAVPNALACPVFLVVDFDTPCACDRSIRYFDQIEPLFLADLPEAVYLCAGDNLELSVCADFTLSLTPSNGGTITDLGGGTIQVSINPGFGEDQPVTLLAMSRAGSCDFASSRALYQLPNLEIGPYNPVRVCDNAISQLSLNLPPEWEEGAVVLWSPTLYLDDPTSPNPEIIEPQASITYTVIVSFNDGQCSVSAPFPVIVESPGSLTVVSSADQGCVPIEQDVVLTATAGYDQYILFQIIGGFPVFLEEGLSNIFMVPNDVVATYQIAGIDDDKPCEDVSDPVPVMAVYCRDFGDMPDTYATLEGSNGPSHALITGLYLGLAVDDEPNGQPSANALGDGADEDGVNFLSHLNWVPGGTIRLPFTAVNTTGQPSYVRFWIDWNGDGVFDPSEMIEDLDDDGQPYPAYLTVPIPTTVVRDQLLGFRIRLSQEDNLSFDGPSLSGEVEDYMIRITCPDEPCLPAQISR